MRRKQNEPLLPAVDYTDDLINLACDMVDIPDLDEDTPKNFVVRRMLGDGRVGFWDTDSDARGFYRMTVDRSQLDRFGDATTFVFYTGEASARPFNVSRSDGAVEIKANATATPAINAFRRYAALLQICDRSIAANIRAQIYGRIIHADNNQTDEALSVLLDRLESGKPLTLDDSGLAAVGALESYDISTPVTFDRVQAARSMIWSEALKRCGSVAANEYRTVRTQSAEIDATVSETIDLVYIMINSFNEACRRYNITNRAGKVLEMVYTGFSARFDEDGTREQMTGEEVVENGQI